MRDLGGGTCEMKRLYVAPECRGSGVGKMLAGEVVSRAERAGYRRMVLDTIPEMEGALALYRSLGFVETGRYYDNPVERTICLERPLGGHDTLVRRTIRMGNEPLAEVVQDDMAAYFDHLAARIERLVRSLCQHCAQKGPLAPGQFTELVKEYVYASPLSEEEGSKRLLAAAGAPTPEEATIKTAQGCERCSGKGYKGRMGIYEILQNSPEMRLLIQRSARPTEIFDEASRAGMHSLRHDALEKCFQGLIDLRQARLAYL